VLVLAAFVPAAHAAATDVNLNFYPVSARSLNKDFWDPVDTQYAFGGTVDFGHHGAPIHFAFGLHSSIGTQSFSNPLINDTVGTVSELSFGIAKVWETKGRVRPFIGGGASFVQASLALDVPTGTATNRDDSIGWWIEAGVYWRIGRHFDLGFSGRTLMGTSITLFGVDGDANYWQVGPMLGWSWPPRS
jgi:hypothetical protein